MQFDYADPDSDLALAVVTVDEPEATFSTTVPLTGAPRSGTGQARLVLDARYVPATYTVGVEVSDAGGLASARRTASFQVSAGAPAAFAVSGVSPAAGRTGDLVAVAGVPRAGLAALDGGGSATTRSCRGAPRTAHAAASARRPSTDVITGMIKNNFPACISFRLASRHDSTTIINQAGAEAPLGDGDMLVMTATPLTRVPRGASLAVAVAAFPSGWPACYPSLIGGLA